MGFGDIVGICFLVVGIIFALAFFKALWDYDLDAPIFKTEITFTFKSDEEDENEEKENSAQPQVSQTASSALPESEDSQNPTA